MNGSATMVWRFGIICTVRPENYFTLLYLDSKLKKKRDLNKNITIPTSECWISNQQLWNKCNFFHWPMGDEWRVLEDEQERFVLQ